MTQIDYLSVQQPLPFKSQRGGMIAFGVVFCIIGLFCMLSALMLPLALLVMASAATTQPICTWTMILPMMLAYLLIAGFFIFLGIDNFRAKRWVRPISIVCSGLGFLGGLLAVISVVIQWSTMQQLMNPNGATAANRTDAFVGLIIGVGISVVFYLILPGLTFWFYRRDAVTQTVYHFDRSPSWTDGVPLRVITAGVGTLMFGLGAVFLLMRPEVPMFTAMLRGPAIPLAVLPIVVVCSFGAVQLFRQQMLGWWIAMIVPAIHVLGQIVGLQVYGVSSMYQGMNITAAQQRILTDSTMQSPTAMAITLGTLIVVWMIFLIYVKPVIRRVDPPAAGESAAS